LSHELFNSIIAQVLD